MTDDINSEILKLPAMRKLYGIEHLSFFINATSVQVVLDDVKVLTKDKFVSEGDLIKYEEIWYSVVSIDFETSEVLCRQYK